MLCHLYLVSLLFNATLQWEHNNVTVRQVTCWRTRPCRRRTRDAAARRWLVERQTGAVQRRADRRRCGGARDQQVLCGRWTARPVDAGTVTASRCAMIWTAGRHRQPPMQVASSCACTSCRSWTAGSRPDCGRPRADAAGLSAGRRTAAVLRRQPAPDDTTRQASR